MIARGADGQRVARLHIIEQFDGAATRIGIAQHVGAGYLHRINHGAQTATLFDAVSNYWWLGGTYLPVPQIALDAQFGHISVNSSSAGASVIAARAAYLLSKRSSVYVTVGHMFNERNATFTVDGGVLPPASTPLPGVDQTGVMVGVRHQF
ncbi:hypothetical protein PTKU64_48230 [Paraburkholderia terrae]|uniref:Porin n=1 Tax=Paraburkholderia terrae TaxID=311230 RepID=A0ABN6JJU8_9BURK|nr:hypothetical protein PTKU64_48230 [Paraburkholderia terrae]